MKRIQASNQFRKFLAYPEDWEKSLELVKDRIEWLDKVEEDLLTREEREDLIEASRRLYSILAPICRRLLGGEQ